MIHNFIVIEGNIGAGKTSLAKKIADDNNAKIILERFADNPFLPKFYKNPDRYSFPLELSFLAERYNQLKNDLTSPDLFKAFTIADYYFMKSMLFAKNTLPNDEFKLYRQIFDIIYQSLPKPDIYVFLHKSIDNLLQNIKKRGREYEQEITYEYLEGIQNGYFDFFRQDNSIPFLVIDTNNIDFVNNKVHYKLISDAILTKKYEPGLNRLILKGT